MPPRSPGWAWLAARRQAPEYPDQEREAEPVEEAAQNGAGAPEEHAGAEGSGPHKAEQHPQDPIGAEPRSGEVGRAVAGAMPAAVAHPFQAHPRPGGPGRRRSRTAPRGKARPRVAATHRPVAPCPRCWPTRPPGAATGSPIHGTESTKAGKPTLFQTALLEVGRMEARRAGVRNPGPRRRDPVGPLDLRDLHAVHEH